VLVVPLMIWIVYRLFGVATALGPLAVELVLLVTVAAPLALGIVLARLRPGAAPRLAALADRVGGVVLLLASGAFPSHEATVIGAVLLYLLAALLLAGPYDCWRTQVACAQPHFTNP
jgi:predicted neutral ceramidase superfamily lipid hydrolase